MGRSWPDLWCQAVSRRWSKKLWPGGWACVCRRRFGGRVHSLLAICGERLSTIEHVSHDDCCKSDSILQGAVTGDHVVLAILRNLIQAPHILWHKHFERVEIVGALSGIPSRSAGRSLT